MKLFGKQHRDQRIRTAVKSFAGLEPLEGRQLMSFSPVMAPINPVFTLHPIPVLQAISVTNTNDSGTGSLRQAITTANASSSPDVDITFAVSGTFQPGSDLPAISHNNVDFTTGSESITLDGSRYSKSDTTGTALQLTGSYCTVDGLTIKNFQNGIVVNGGQLNKIGSNTFPSGIGQTAIEVTNNASNNQISSNTFTSGIGQEAVLISGGVNSTVSGNTIGNLAAGQKAALTIGNGIVIKNSSMTNTIYGNTFQYGISQDAILIQGGSLNQVLGNFVYEFGKNGIEISGSSNNTIGDATSMDVNDITPNVNSSAGIVLDNGSSNNQVGENVIQSTKVGLLIDPTSNSNNVAGVAVSGVSKVGIEVEGANNSITGCEAEFVDNGPCIDVQQGSGNTIGTAAFPNVLHPEDGQYGITVESNNNTGFNNVYDTFGNPIYGVKTSGTTGNVFKST